MPIQAAALAFIATFALFSSVADGAAVAASSSPPRDGDAAAPELLLAGGSLGLCSSLSPRQCVDGTQFGDARSMPGYRFDAARIDIALDPLLWPGRDQAFLAGLSRQLAAMQRLLGDQLLDEHRFIAALQAGCSDCSEPVAWRRMDDHERASLLATFEEPQLGSDGIRLRERVDAQASRRRGGVQVVQRFVDAARARAGGATPRIAFVTASALDSFDPVDFYTGLFREFGAEPLWWPVDAALAAAVFGDADCAALEPVRRRELGMPRRAELYPDLADAQRRWCERDDAADFPPGIHGVFFAGGDQWRLRRALVDANDQPNGWLRGLRAAFDDGRIVVGGTSAGSAVQSGPGMLSNGTPQHALAHAARFAPPPTPGCTRDNRCGGLDEDAMTLWRAGGLGLAGPLLVDTHFSERAREWRLLRALAAAGQRWGVGVDEASAIVLRRVEHGHELEAVGASGGWLFGIDSVECGRISARAAYLAPGVRIAIGERGMQWLDAAKGAAVVNAVDLPSDPFAPGAVRAQAWRLARGEVDAAQLEAGPALLQLSRSAEARVWQAVGSAPGVFGLDLALSFTDAGCAAR
jgi:cyanophycinase